MNSILKMTLKSASKLVPSDVQTVVGKVSSASSHGYKRGIRARKINKKGSIMTNVGASVGREIRSLNFTAKEAPAVAAAVVAMIPIPSPIPITPIVYGIGKGIQKGYEIIKRIM